MSGSATAVPALEGTSFRVPVRYVSLRLTEITNSPELLRAIPLDQHRRPTCYCLQKDLQVRRRKLHVQAHREILSPVVIVRQQREPTRAESPTESNRTHATKREDYAEVFGSKTYPT